MFYYAILSIPSLRSVMATSRRSRSTAKSLKRVTTSGLEGTWDTKCHCISLDLPVGVASIKMIVEGVDGVHTMDFSSFECSASFVQWKDYDYPWSSSDFLLAREAWRQGDINPHLPPPFTASKVSVWRRKHFFTMFVTNSELWETYTL